MDEDALRNAVELHDALSHLPPRILGHDSPERVAATLTFRFFVDCGYPEASALKISNIIMATNPDVRPITTEEIIMRAADMWNTGASFREFKEASIALHQEAQIAKRVEIPFSHWIGEAFLYLERFMWPMLELTPEARDDKGRSTYHTNAVRNMVTLWQETFGDSTEVTAEFIPRGDIAPGNLPHRSFYIAIHPNEQARQDSLGRLDKHALAANGAALAVPGDSGAFPLPDGLCSHVRCRDASLESLAEALRITKEGGTIILDLPEDIDPSVLEVAKPFRCTLSNNSPDGALERVLIITKSVIL